LEVSLKPNKQFWLADFDIALLSAGEESGRLDASFRLLARYYNSRAKIIRDTIAGLIITFITLHVFFIVFPIGFLTDFVLGIVNNDYAKCLPFIIEKALVFGGLYGSLWFLAFASQDTRGEGWRRVVEFIMGKIPLLRSAVKYLAVARLAMALDALLSAGVPVIRGWELAATACGSPHLKREIFKWTPELESGTTPSEMVTQIRYFPDMFMQLYHSGEISGKLDETLTRLHTYFEEEGFRKLQAFCRVLNFVVYFLIAITIAIFVIRFWMHYYGAMLNSF
jgi:type IV pilus assembly protein PilC